MVFFRKKENRNGKTSQISKLRSPYRQKTIQEPKRRKKAKMLPTIPFSPRIGKKGMSHKAKLLFATIMSTGIAIFLIYTVFFSPYFEIENFIIEEKGTVIDDYQKMRTILGNLIGKNIFLINESDLKAEILSFHPEIENIKIVKSLPKTVKIEYEKYPTIANLVNLVNGIQKRFLLDSQGFLVEENMEQLDLPYIYLKTTAPLEVRQSFLGDASNSEEKLAFIVNSIHLFEEKFGIKVLYADFLPVEREVHLQTEKYFTVMIDMQKNLNRQIDKLKKALSKLDIYNTPLQYIDLRISGTDTEKVIFKKK